MDSRILGVLSQHSRWIRLLVPHLHDLHDEVVIKIRDSFRFFEFHRELAWLLPQAQEPKECLKLEFLAQLLRLLKVEVFLVKWTMWHAWPNKTMLWSMISLMPLSFDWLDALIHIFFIQAFGLALFFCGTFVAQLSAQRLQALTGLARNAQLWL